MTNKFNLRWQLTRVAARAIKDVTKKIAFVLDFLKKHPSVHNYARVYNWIGMTKLGYPMHERGPFHQATKFLETHRADFGGVEDDDVDIKSVSTEDLEKVKADLAKRKYDFQFGSKPQSHIEFVEKLSKELKRRSNENVESGPN